MVFRIIHNDEDGRNAFNNCTYTNYELKGLSRVDICVSEIIKIELGLTKLL